MALLLGDVEEGKGVQISLGGRIYGFEGTGLEKEGENKVTRDKRQTRRGADTTVQVTSIVVSRGDQVLTSRDPFSSSSPGKFASKTQLEKMGTV